MNILISGNDTYAFPTEIFLTSLFENSGQYGIDVYFLYNQLSDYNMAVFNQVACKYENCQIIYIYVDILLFNGTPLTAVVNPYITIETYFRLALSELLPSNVDKILYLDTDIIINSDIISFYNREFKKEIAAVVCDDYGLIMSDKIRKKVYKNLEFKTNDRYFNAGVILFNVKYVRKNLSLNKFMQFIHDHKNYLMFHDQDVLNAMLKEHVVYEDYNVYNCRPFYYPYTKRGSENIRKASIIHYGEKPWNDDFSDLGGNLFWKYAFQMGYKIEYEEWKRKNNAYRKRKFIALTLRYMKRNVKNVLVKG